MEQRPEWGRANCPSVMRADRPFFYRKSETNAACCMYCALQSSKFLTEKKVLLIRTEIYIKMWIGAGLSHT